MEESARIVRIACAVVFAWTLTAPARAADAHVHGVASLQVALDGNRLNVEFSSPLDNLVGFEHAPRTDKQKAAVREMAERLNAPELWFVPNAEAACKRTSVGLQSPVLERSLPAGGSAPGKSGASPNRDARK